MDLYIHMYIMNQAPASQAESWEIWYLHTETFGELRRVTVSASLVVHNHVKPGRYVVVYVFATSKFLQLEKHLYCTHHATMRSATSLGSRYVPMHVFPCASTSR